MIRDLIIELAPTVLLVLFVIFTIVKVSVMSVGMNKSYLQLFLISFLFFSKQTVRNTFHVKLKRFYERSNRINSIFYALAAVVVTFYVLMRSL